MALDIATVLSFKTFVEAGMVKATPPLGPLAGQYGVNIKPLCADLNALTSKYAKGLPLPVYVVKSSLYSKGYKAFVKPPTIAFLLTLMFYTESRNSAFDFSEGLDCKALYDVARVHSAMLNGCVVDSAKALFSYLNSAQIFDPILPDEQ
jgi:ribosomal protein L11